MSEKRIAAHESFISDLHSRRAKRVAMLAIATTTGVFWYSVLNQEVIEASVPASAVEVETEKIGDAVYIVPAVDEALVYCGGVETNPPIPFVDRQHNKIVEPQENGKVLITCDGIYGTRINVQQ